MRRKHSPKGKERQHVQEVKKPLTHFVIGRNPVREVLRHNHDRVRAIFTTSDGKSPAASGRTLRTDQDLWDQVSRLNLKPIVTSFDQLSARVGTESHQGWVLEVTPRAPVQLRDFLSDYEHVDEGLLLLLDGVEDPQNLGSILRAAECFGVEAVIWSRNRGVGLTPSAVKASAGASELVTQIEVANLHDAVLKCRAAGWWIVGANVSEKAGSVFEYEGPRKIALVLGSEGAGLHHLIQRSVDQELAIPLKGKLDSLNVGQAAAVMLAVLSARVAPHAAAHAK